MFVVSLLFILKDSGKHFLLLILLSSRTDIDFRIMLVSMSAMSALATDSVSGLLSFRLGDMAVLSGVRNDVVDIGGG